MVESRKIVGQNLRKNDKLTNLTVYISLAEVFVDPYEKEKLSVEDLRRLTWEEMQSFVQPTKDEVGVF